MSSGLFTGVPGAKIGKLATTPLPATLTAQLAPSLNEPTPFQAIEGPLALTEGKPLA
jgi:hypothetical protein